MRSSCPSITFAVENLQETSANNDFIVEQTYLVLEKLEYKGVQCLEYYKLDKAIGLAVALI